MINKKISIFSNSINCLCPKFLIKTKNPFTKPRSLFRWVNLSEPPAPIVEPAAALVPADADPAESQRAANVNQAVLQAPSVNPEAWPALNVPQAGTDNSPDIYQINDHPSNTIPSSDE